VFKNLVLPTRGLQVETIRYGSRIITEYCGAVLANACKSWAIEIDAPDLLIFKYLDYIEIQNTDAVDVYLGLNTNNPSLYIRLPALTGRTVYKQPFSSFFLTAKTNAITADKVLYTLKRMELTGDDLARMAVR
jgi:hypothetical protein